MSVEARKEKDQDYNPLYGTFGTYNLFYMFVDEKDINTLRTVVRDDKLYSFKLKLTDEQKNNLFKEVLRRGIETSEKPEFYNTLFSSCTTNVFDEINSVLPKKERVGFDWRILIPENSTEIFYEKGLLEYDVEKFPSYESLKNSSNIQNAARENRDQESKDFSEKIHKIIVTN